MSLTNRADAPYSALKTELAIAGPASLKLRRARAIRIGVSTVVRTVTPARVPPTSPINATAARELLGAISARPYASRVSARIAECAILIIAFPNARLMSEIIRGAVAIASRADTESVRVFIPEFSTRNSYEENISEIASYEIVPILLCAPVRKFVMREADVKNPYALSADICKFSNVIGAVEKEIICLEDTKRGSRPPSVTAICKEDKSKFAKGFDIDAFATFRAGETERISLPAFSILAAMREGIFPNVSPKP